MGEQVAAGILKKYSISCIIIPGKNEVFSREETQRSESELPAFFQRGGSRSGVCVDEGL